MSWTLCPVGGVGEFGANCFVVDLSFGGRLVLDTGVALGTLEEYGVSFEVPDFSSLGKPEPFLALLSHGHDDHLKGLPLFRQAFPATKLAATADTWPWIRRLLGGEANGLVVKEELVFEGVQLSAIPCSHSIPGTALFRVIDDQGTLVLATDFRLAPSALGEETDMANLAQWGEEGVDVLLLDATNTLLENSPPSEATVAETLAEIVARTPGAVIAVTFASHLGRFWQLYQAAKLSGRVVVPVGRGIEEMLALQMERGALFSPGTVRSPQELPRFPKEQLMLVVTGSQGESLAVFPRLARDELPHFRLGPGDTVIHAARIIPGNERRLAHLFDQCVRRGAWVITAQEAPVHASGHASLPELVRVLEVLRPKWVVPIHGRLRQLVALADRAKLLGIKAVVTENGRPLRFQGGSLSTHGDPQPLGRILVGLDRESLDSAVVWERMAAAKRGVVVAVLAIPANPQAPLPNPHIECFGLRLPGINRAHLASQLGGVLRHACTPVASDPEKLRATMQGWLTAELRKRLGNPPRVVALVVEF